jgi:hypothetical protein
MKKKESLLRSNSGSTIFVLDVCIVEVKMKLSRYTRCIIKTVGMLYLKNSYQYLRLADADGLKKFT